MFIVGLKQNGPWTIGGLANHVWSVAGSDNRSDINSTYIQPFISYNTPIALTYALNMEASYYWESEQWSIPGPVTLSDNIPCYISRELRECIYITPHGVLLT